MKHMMTDLLWLRNLGLYGDGTAQPENWNTCIDCEDLTTSGHSSTW